MTPIIRQHMVQLCARYIGDSWNGDPCAHVARWYLWRIHGR